MGGLVRTMGTSISQALNGRSAAANCRQNNFNALPCSAAIVIDDEATITTPSNMKAPNALTKSKSNDNVSRLVTIVLGAEY